MLCCLPESRVRADASAVQDFYVPSADLCMVGKIYNFTCPLPIAFFFFFFFTNK